MFEDKKDGVERRALVVAAEYRGLEAKYQLEGTINDARRITCTISSTPFNFSQDHIKLLIGDDASRSNILQNLEQLCEEATNGSVVLFFFAGHGTYLQDVQDEGILPSDVTTEMLHNDAEKRRISITGPDFAPYLKKLAEKDVSTTFIFDCCHSGHIYRGLEFKENKFKLLRARQIEMPRLLDSARSDSDPSSKETRKPLKWQRAGWRPSGVDKFFHIAACSSVEKAYEGLDTRTGMRCGLLTYALCGVLDNLKNPERVSYKALFSLIMREFKENGVPVKQTPQFEGGDINTTVFGKDTVPEVKSIGVMVEDVVKGSGGERDEVILNAGRLQLLPDGEYDIFEPTVTQEEISSGKESTQWVASVDVNERDIFETRATAYIIEIAQGKRIRLGCGAYLREATSFRHRVMVTTIPGDQLHEENLTKQLTESNMFHVHLKLPEKDTEDMIVVSCESIQGSNRYLVARRGGRVIAPPISLDRGDVMVDNLCRLLRYELALKEEDSNNALMTGVTFKVTKMEKVRAYKGGVQKSETIEQGLKNRDLYADLIERPKFERPKFDAHLIGKRSDRGRVRLSVIPGSGDAVVYQITNNEKFLIHVCVLMFQIDGSVVSLYPDRSGRTQELRPGDTIEDIHRLFIPELSLRVIASPDPREPEPRFGVDTIMLYATSEEASYESLVQTAVEVEPELVPRTSEEREPLNPLSKFRLAIKQRCSVDALEDEGPSWLVEKREFEVWKNPPDP